jgi:O-acetylhomoserine (thiol)-lyase
MKKDLSFETLQLHGGQEVDKATNSRAVPIYQTASYVLDSTSEAEKLFSAEKFGFTYSRISNPTVAVLEKRVALLEGGIDATAYASGTAAIVASVLNITQAGDNILAAKNLYGGTYTLFKNSLPPYGITVNFFDPHNLAEIEEKIDKNTKAIYLESIGNPNAELLELKLITEIAHKNGIPVIIDNTFATPYLYRPFEFGADIVVHSVTKFLGGHGTTIGGIVVDSGRFPFANNEKFPMFNIEDSNIGGKRYSDFGEKAYSLRIKKRILTDFGACLSPFNAFMLLQGIETLSLRVERHVENALKIVEFLDKHPKIAWVSHPASKNSRFKEILKRDFPKGAGSIFTFGVKGGVEEGKKFIDSLNLFSHLANVADAKSLIIHPASTTHAQLTKEQQAFAGLKPETIRISVGLEHVNDSITDLEQALQQI